MAVHKNVYLKNSLHVLSAKSQSVNELVPKAANKNNGVNVSL